MREEHSLQWLPQSRTLRFLLALSAGGASVFVFLAWQNPDMVFDFANFLFCA